MKERPAASAPVPAVLLVGVGGYGGSYLKAMRPALDAGRLSLAGVVDPVADKAPSWPELAAAGVPRFDTLPEATAAGLRADLTVIASPIAFHADQACQALAAGMPVLCEKPIAATLREVDRMAAARDAAGRFVAVGYQWSFSPAVLDLKRDLLAGRLGRPRRFKTRVAWPRDSHYYGRNRWAGRVHDEAGRPVLDSPVNNATAHYLHNMLFLLGPGLSLAAAPRRVSAARYRANDIENYDAACLHAALEGGAEILYYAAHCVNATEGPVFDLLCDEATVHFAGEHITATWSDGRTRDYGAPESEPRRKLEVCLAAATGAGGEPIPCVIETARMHTVIVNTIQQAPLQLAPEDQRVRQTLPSGAVLTHVPGMNAAIRRAYDGNRLIEPRDLPWTEPARDLPLAQ